MESKMKNNIQKTKKSIESLKEKINYLDENSVEMTWDDYELAHTQTIDEIISVLDVIHEQLDFLNENESKMTWEVYDEMYEELFDYQTELTEKQFEYSIKLSEGYSEQLEELEVEPEKGNLAWNVTRKIGGTIFSGIKKGATYVWDNKEELYASMMEKGEEQQNRIREDKARMENLVNRQSIEELERNIQDIHIRHQNGETISLEEKFYVKAAKEKIKDQES